MILPKEQILSLLDQGTIELQGEFLWGSNYTFLVEVSDKSASFRAVYKPARGERPLWDFPTASLGRRETAAFHVSELLGWELVPPTVYRKKGPLGSGSLQIYINHDVEYHYFNFSPEDRQRLRPTVLFDCLINNADRKGSHILRGEDSHFWLIDHGICFHVEDKLRTVIWDFAGEPIPDELLQDLDAFVEKIDFAKGEYPKSSKSLLKYISLAEVRAMKERAVNLVKNRYFPLPDPHRRPFPWPQI